VYRRGWSYESIKVQFDLREQNRHRPMPVDFFICEPLGQEILR
jgi:hypothetical protein